MVLAKVYLGYSVTELLEHLHALSPVTVWVFLVLHFLTAYLDFSAYSDIAIGASRLFGLRVMENFNWPIFASSISDFWRRWHMTLARWCQSYVYMPVIGLTRNPYAAIFSTFIVMGLWHAGALHWFAWGLHHALGVAVYTRWARWTRTRGWAFTAHWAWRPVATAITILYVSVAGAYTSTFGVAPFADALRIVARLAFIPIAP